MEQSFKLVGQNQVQQGNGNQLEQQNERQPNTKQKKFLKILHQKPDATYKVLAEDMNMGLNADNVGDLIDPMRKKGWIDNGFRIIPRVLGYPERYRVDITVIPINLRKGEGGRPTDIDKDTKERIPVRTQQGLAKYIVNTLSKYPAFEDTILVEEVSVLLGGPADLSAIIWAKDNESMLKFVTYGLRMAEGIQTTSTSIEHWSYPTKRL